MNPTCSVQFNTVDLKYMFALPNNNKVTYTSFSYLGKSLVYSYWAPDEPSSFLGFLSLENCCCMRRSDSWKWHDYHCHMDGYEYNFICQFRKFISFWTCMTIQSAHPVQQIVVKYSEKLIQENTLKRCNSRRVSSVLHYIIYSHLLYGVA